MLLRSAGRVGADVADVDRLGRLAAVIAAIAPAMRLSDR